MKKLMILSILTVVMTTSMLEALEFDSIEDANAFYAEQENIFNAILERAQKALADNDDVALKKAIFEISYNAIGYAGVSVDVFRGFINAGENGISPERAEKVLHDIIRKGKQIWYSMSHGGTDGGKPWHPFVGLKFKDGGAIRISELSPLKLNYKLVVVDGCCSAQTNLKSEWDARNVNTLLPHAQSFANAFGPEVAYMGWSWTMEPNSSQSWSTTFVNNLKFDPTIKKGRTVNEAYQKFLNDHAPGSSNPAPAAHNMKIHGATGTIIETLKKE